MVLRKICVNNTLMNMKEFWFICLFSSSKKLLEYKVKLDILTFSAVFKGRVPKK